jgi:pimeloyl-ACP methyl ester carboxylesterase
VPGGRERARALSRAPGGLGASASSGTSGFEGTDTCLEWPADPTAEPPLAPGARLPDVPALVLSGDLDTNTPPSAGRQVARRFGHATWAPIANAGHTPTDGSPCAVTLATRFVRTLKARPDACARP